uniref:Mitochondrial resolvase Ydc2 catalytic domain-containing protein n=1 Tax=viral metagenome TaxID=1070528 RepID=A0A6C0JI97_9ZZZZ
MTKLLSFDVGIKNLAYCLVEFNNINDHKIVNWGIIDIMKDFTDNALNCSVSKNGKGCSSKAINYIKGDEKDIGFCNKKYCQSILNSVYNKKNIKKCKKVNTKTVSLLEISKSMIKNLNEIPELLNVDRVIIENQPVLKNPTMKSIQMILYSFFVMKGMVEKEKINDILMFNAGRKLEIYNGPEINYPENIKKDTYKCRKYESIEFTKYFLREDKNKLDFFNKHKKKDDLADSYLQCLTYYKKNYKNA